MRRADLFFAFADKHEIYWWLLPCRFESMQRAEKRRLGTLLIYRAATDADAAQAFSLDKTSFKRGEDHSEGSNCFTSYMK